MPHCTSDGTQCIPRRKCTQAFYEASCVSQPDGQLCQWTSSKQCSVRSCSVAPKTLTTHSQCQSYLKNCTTQKNGGCINLMQCIEYSINEQCQIDTLLKPCVWDTTKNWCRNQECQDQFGNNHKSCQAFSKECTADFVKKGYCMDILECSEYTKKLHCIIGTDGSCLWVNNQCYQYSQCEDIQFKTHEECQKVSKDCTTDGNQCVPITFCQETNTNGGCYLGIDGECIQIVKDDVNVCIVQFDVHLDNLQDEELKHSQQQKKSVIKIYYKYNQLTNVYIFYFVNFQYQVDIKINILHYIILKLYAYIS